MPSWLHQPSDRGSFDGAQLGGLTQVHFQLVADHQRIILHLLPLILDLIDNALIFFKSLDLVLVGSFLINHFLHHLLDKLQVLVNWLGRRFFFGFGLLLFLFFLLLEFVQSILVLILEFEFEQLLLVFGVVGGWLELSRIEISGLGDVVREILAMFFSLHMFIYKSADICVRGSV